MTNVCFSMENTEYSASVCSLRILFRPRRRKKGRKGSINRKIVKIDFFQTGKKGIESKYRAAVYRFREIIIGLAVYKNICQRSGKSFHFSNFVISLLSSLVERLEKSF